jgi:hypothetical protein
MESTNPFESRKTSTFPTFRRLIFGSYHVDFREFSALQEFGEQFGWNAASKFGSNFQNSGNIREILLSFAPAAIGVRGCPDLSLQKIFDMGNRKSVIHHLADFSALDEIEIAWVRLDLNLKLRIGGGDINAMRKANGEI